MPLLLLAATVGGGGPQMLLPATVLLPPLLLPPTGLAERMGEMPTLLSYFHVSEEKGSTVVVVGELRFNWLSEVELWRRCIMGDLAAASPAAANRSMPSGSTIATGREDDDDEGAPPPPLFTAAPHNLIESGAEAIRVTFW